MLIEAGLYNIGSIPIKVRKLILRRNRIVLSIKKDTLWTFCWVNDVIWLPLP